jgi:hypothetical protein
LFFSGIKFCPLTIQLLKINYESEKNQMARNNQNTWRFYRSNLETIVWDPENDRPLVEFIQGEFITSDPRIAEKLLELGYPRVPLEAVDPPDVIFEKGHSLEGDVRVLPENVGEVAALNREKAQAAIEKQKAEIKSPADYQKTKIKRRKTADQPKTTAPKPKKKTKKTVE